MNLESKFKCGMTVLKRMMECSITQNTKFFKIYSEYMENKIIFPVYQEVLNSKINNSEKIKQNIAEMDNIRQSLHISIGNHVLSSVIKKEDALRDSLSRYSSLREKICFN